MNVNWSDVLGFAACYAVVLATWYLYREEIRDAIGLEFPLPFVHGIIAWIERTRMGPDADDQLTARYTASPFAFLLTAPDWQVKRVSELVRAGRAPSIPEIEGWVSP